MERTTLALGTALLSVCAIGSTAIAQSERHTDAKVTTPAAVEPGTTVTVEPRVVTTKNEVGKAMVLPTGGPQGTLYYSQDSNANGLFILSQSSGFATNVGITDVTGSTVGLAPSPTPGVLYGSQPFNLLEINADGSGVAFTGGGIGIEGLAFNGVTLYGAINGNFFTVDPSTGLQDIDLGPAPGDIEGIAFGNGGVYGLAGQDSNLYFYDPSSGLWSAIGNTGITWDNAGLAFDPLTNSLFAKGSQDTFLYRINPGSGATGLVGDTGLALGGGLAWLPPAPGGPPILYGLSSTSLGRVYTIDSSGAASLQFGLNGDASFTGISFLDDVLYGTDLIDYPGGTGGWDFGRIDVPSGMINFISDQDGSSNWQGLASNETTGELYSWDITDTVLKVQSPNGPVAAVGAGTGIDGRGLAFDDVNQILYATDTTSSSLYRVDISTGTSTLIGPTGVTLGFFVGLAFDEITRTLYMNLGDVNALYILDTATGGASFVGPNGVVAIDGLAWRPPFEPCGKVLYGASNGLAQGVGFSTLYRIDPSSGDWTEVGPIGFDNVTGLAFAPNGTLYASANGDAIFGPTTSILLTIDRLTGLGTLVGIIGQSTLPNSVGRMPDISFSPDGTLFGYGDAMGGTAEGLYRIALGGPSPLGSFVGPTGFFGGGNGMDFAPNGALYATPFDDNCLVRINPATGAGACVDGTAGNVPARMNALDFCLKTGDLYGSLNGGDGSSLVTLDLATGVATQVFPTVLGLDAIAFLCPVTCPWDLNGNNMVDFGDLLIVLSTWGPCPGCPADFNGNNIVEFNDLLVLLSNWGPCAEPVAACQPPGACPFFVPCAEGCVCFTLSDGSGFCGGSIGCADVQPCDDNGQCPDGFVCQVDTCCDGPICVPEDTACTLSPGAPTVYPVGTRTSAGVVAPDGTLVP